MHEAHRGFRAEQGLPWPAATQGDGVSLQDETDCALCCFIIHLQAFKFYFRYFILAAVIQVFLNFWAKAYRLIFNKKQEHLKQVLLNNLEKHGCASFLAHMDALTNGFSMAKFGSDMMTHVLLTLVRHFKRDSQRIVKAVYCMHLHTAAFGSS